MTVEFIILISTVVQIVAAVLAIRLIRVTDRLLAWILIALALIGMAARRALPLYHYIVGGNRDIFDAMTFELIGLATSACMVIGIAGIAPLFRSIRDNAEALRRSEERYRRIVDTAQEGIWVIDDSGRTLFVNKRMTEILRAPESEIVGRSVGDFLDESEVSKLPGILERRQSGVREQYDMRLRRTDGTELWAIVSGTPVYDEQGRFLGSMGLLTDISERKRLEKEREGLIAELRGALANVKTLSGLLPICASCKNIRDDQGYWNQIETYISDHSMAEFTHSLCPDCIRKLYGTTPGVMAEAAPPRGNEPT